MDMIPVVTYIACSRAVQCNISTSIAWHGVAWLDTTQLRRFYHVESGRLDRLKIFLQSMQSVCLLDLRAEGVVSKWQQTSSAAVSFSEKMLPVVTDSIFSKNSLEKGSPADYERANMTAHHLM